MRDPSGAVPCRASTQCSTVPGLGQEPPTSSTLVTRARCRHPAWNDSPCLQGSTGGAQALWLAQALYCSRTAVPIQNRGQLETSLGLVNAGKSWFDGAILTPCRQAALPSGPSAADPSQTAFLRAPSHPPLNSRHVATAATLEGRAGPAWLPHRLSQHPARALSPCRPGNGISSPHLTPSTSEAAGETAPLPQDTGTERWVRACRGTHTHTPARRARRDGKTTWVSREISCFSSPTSPCWAHRFSCPVQETHLLTERAGVTSIQHHCDLKKTSSNK